MKYPHLPGCRCKKYEEVLDKNDPWWIDAPEYYNCFFTYMRHNTGPHTLNEIANHLDLSISAITAIERKALMKLKRRVGKFKMPIPKKN